MKFSKKLTMAAVATLALVGTAACSKSGNSSSSSSEKIPSKITKKTTVVFWNAMPGVQGSTLKQLTNEFEKKNPKITVKLENQGAYNDLQAKINSSLSRLALERSSKQDACKHDPIYQQQECWLGQCKGI